MEDFGVKITEVHLVAPATPTERQELPVSTFDLMQKRDAMPYLQRIAFYKSTGISEAEQDSFILSLKNSLANVLVHFYPLAGRLCFPGGRPAIDCNDKGAELSVAVAEASLENIDISQYSPVFKKLIQRGFYEETTMTGTAPILALQVTKFPCGGISLAWSFDHVAVDGIGMMHFLTSWAEVARGAPISKIPKHDRSFEKRDKDLAPVIDNIKSFSYKFVDPTTNVVCRNFSFDEEDIKKTKGMAGVDDEKSLFTTYETIAAHLWVVLTKVRNLPKSQRTRIQMAVNCRQRMTPPLPEGFFGNAVLPGMAESTAEEIESGGNAAAAILVKNAARNFGMEDIRSQILTYNENYQNQNPMSQGLTDGVDIFFGSSLRHPLYELDFGLGKPAAVRHGRFLWDGFCFLDPSPKGGKNIDLTIHLPPKIMEAFAAKIKCFE